MDVTVANGANTPPSVQITSPVEGATVGATVTLFAQAAGGHPIVNVTFFVDGSQVGQPVTAPPYTIQWDTTSSTAGMNLDGDCGRRCEFHGGLQFRVGDGRQHSPAAADREGSNSVRRWAGHDHDAVILDGDRKRPAGCVRGLRRSRNRAAVGNRHRRWLDMDPV